MKYRKLRIAFSVTCGIACVLLVVLWVRSYWAPGSFAGMGYNGVSKWGVIAVFRAEPRTTFTVQGGYSVVRFGVPVAKFSPLNGRLGFYTLWEKKLWVLQIPYWFPAAMTFTLSVLPWIKWSWRFSLRTLLITTTFVAVVLGLIIYAVR